MTRCDDTRLRLPNLNVAKRDACTVLNRYLILCTPCSSQCSGCNPCME